MNSQATPKVNALGNPMKAYSIQKFYGAVVANEDHDITLCDLLGKTDFEAEEIDAIADLQVDGAPLRLDISHDSSDAALVITRTR
jgi:hypothetical protein